MLKILLLGLMLVLLWYFWFISKKPKIVHQATPTEEAVKNLLQTITELSAQNAQLEKDNQQLLTRLNKSLNWDITLSDNKPEKIDEEVEKLKSRLDRKKKAK